MGDVRHKLATPAKITISGFQDVPSMSALVDIGRHFGDVRVPILLRRLIDTGVTLGIIWPPQIRSLSVVSNMALLRRL